MQNANTHRPLPGTPAPNLEFDVLGADEQRWALERAKPENFSLLVFYRGKHCPVCKSYLQTFEGMFDAIEKRGVEIVALSMDTKSTAEATREEWGIKSIPMGYGLDEETARAWGLYISDSIKDAEPKRFSEPGLFLVQPDRTLHYVAINSMPFGRPEPKAILDAIGFILDEKYPPRGTVKSNDMRDTRSMRPTTQARASSLPLPLVWTHFDTPERSICAFETCSFSFGCLTVPGFAVLLRPSYATTHSMDPSRHRRGAHWPLLLRILDE